jgi:hypothetical protein
VHGGHPLALGIEGNLPDAGERGVELGLLQARAGGGHHQSAFGRVPYRMEILLFVVLQQGIVAQGAAA